MSEERFCNTDEYAGTAKFSAHDGAMAMRQRVHYLCAKLEMGKRLQG